MAIQDRSQDRKGTPVRVLAIHTTEGFGTATELRDASWWEGSAHAIADEETLLSGAGDGCVDYDRGSWTLRSGNNWSDNIELIGWARYTRDEWLTEHDGLLNNCARWLAERSVARGIPLEKISDHVYRMGGTGVIGHVDHTTGYGDGTHTDPGKGFPYDVVIQRARALLVPKEDSLTPEQDKMLNALYNSFCKPVIKGKTLAAALRELLTESDEIRSTLAKHAAPPAAE